MIIDTILFNNEFDMLDIRLALTESYVDKWVICEANKTMNRRPKPLYLTENIGRYDYWGDRLHVVQLEVPESWDMWDIENGQREVLIEGYRDAADDDIIMHSDLDEMLNPDLWPEIVNYLNEHNCPVSCNLDMFVYKFDQKLERKWTGNVVAKKRMFENPCTLYKGLGSGAGHAQKKKNRDHCVRFPKTAGWHWNWMGNDEQIKTKAQSVIEHRNRNSDEVLQQFKQGRPDLAINHKSETTYTADPGYPESVQRVIRQYPWWT